MNNNDAIHDAIDKAIGPTGDIYGVIRELDRAGYIIVPKEPTEEMITAGLIPTSAWQNIEGSMLTVNREKMRLRYVSMIQAVDLR